MKRTWAVNVSVLVVAVVLLMGCVVVEPTEVGPQATAAPGEVELVGEVDRIEGEVWTIGGQSVRVPAALGETLDLQVGDRVRVIGAAQADGPLLATSVTAVAPRPGDDSANTNENANANVNANANDNTNANANTNANENTNANVNANTNANENINANTNENANENVNANENQNTNTNENANENENANTNANENDNSNDNDNDNDDDDDDSNENRSGRRGGD